MAVRNLVLDNIPVRTGLEEVLSAYKRSQCIKEETYLSQPIAIQKFATIEINIFSSV